MAYAHLNIHERKLIALFHEQGKSFREIAKHLGRHHSTISRELKRYKERYRIYYEASSAQDLAWYFSYLPRHAKRRSNKRLYRYVIKQLEAGLSPDIIAGRLLITHPTDHRMRISHETIYRWIYDDQFNQGDLYKHLVRKHKYRKRQGLWPNKEKLAPDRKSIHERPDEVNQRSKIGDWEGDLIEGKRGTGYILTYTERCSRMLIADKLNTKESIVVSMKTIKKLRPIKDRINTITFDNGKEFYDFKKMENKLDAQVYFADPYSSWQRGTNEHANGMLRRFFPKGTDFTTITHRQLKSAIDKINNRPRKVLNYYTPAEVFNGLSGALAM